MELSTSKQTVEYFFHADFFLPRARVRAAFLAAAERSRGPFVREAFFAAAERLDADRLLRDRFSKYRRIGVFDEA